MSTSVYVTGETVRFKFELSSTATTAPETATVHLVLTNPAGADSTYAKASLTQTASTKNVGAVGGIIFYKDVIVATPGRWTYEFVSTGTINTKAGGAIAVARPFASTST